MSETTKKSDIICLEERLDKRFDDLTALMSQFANDTQDHFSEIHIKFSEIQDKLAEHDQEFRKLNDKYDHLLNTIDGFVGRIDRYETELAAA